MKSFILKVLYLCATISTRLYAIVIPYKYDKKRYNGTFLEKTNISDPLSIDLIKPVEEVVYCFWTGPNNLSPNRLSSLDSMRKKMGVRVELITPQNIHLYIKKEDPLPPEFYKLSLNHRSDYLRCYFMHYYGGGYGDIKQYSHSWKDAFNKINKTNAYVLGYREIGCEGVANNFIENKKLKKDLFIYWHNLVGNGAFICRPQTKFTTDWYFELKRRIIYYSDSLNEHPAIDVFGQTNEYPIPWANLMGAIFQPLCLKYNENILYDDALKPSFKNYR